MRARSGAGRLAQAVPDARIVCAAVTGAVDIAKFPTRPRVRVEFFEPESGQHVAGETPIQASQRFNDEIRSRAPVALTRKAEKMRADGRTA